MKTTQTKLEMKVPTSSSEITKEWIQFMLESYHRSRDSSSSSSTSTSSTTTVEVLDFYVAGNEAGLGFNCQLMSLNIQAIINNGETTFTEEYNLQVKLRPSEPLQEELNRMFELDMAEYLIYSKVMDELNDFQASIAGDHFKINIPKMIYGKCTENEFLIVMENLKTKGFDVTNKTKGLDLQHISLAIEQICKFHAVSYVYNKKVNMIEKYRCFQYIPGMYLLFGPLFETYFDSLLELLNIKGRKDISERLKCNKDMVIAEGTKHEEIHAGSAPACLIHGDFWNNNIMFKYEKNQASDQKQAVGCKIIDWSNVVVGNPMFDLQYFMYTSTTRESRKKYLEVILRQYHDTFMEITRQLGSPPPNWSFEDLLKDWHKLDRIMLIFSFLVAFLTHSREASTWSRPKEPGFFDRGIFYPLRVVGEYLKRGATKVMISMMYKTSFGVKIVKFLFKTMTAPVREELLSGENEGLSTRIFDLLCEADERGLFSKPS